jgi:hypothetical protein
MTKPLQKEMVTKELSKRKVLQLKGSVLDEVG